MWCAAAAPTITGAIELGRVRGRVPWIHWTTEAMPPSSAMTTEDPPTGVSAASRAGHTGHVRLGDVLAGRDAVPDVRRALGARHRLTGQLAGDPDLGVVRGQAHLRRRRVRAAAHVHGAVR